MDKKASLSKRLLWLVLSYLLFIIIYNSSAWYAFYFQKSDSFVFHFEKNIPFLEWMIVPYMTSGLLFTLVFFFCSTQKDLMLLTKRINFTTIVSGLFFFLFPLKYSFIKPQAASNFLNLFFQFLTTWDSNYNQAPSLHIGYAVIFWSVITKEFKNPKLRLMLQIWILLLCISTLTVYQHHFIDIITALLLSCITFFIFPDNTERNYKIGLVYSFFSLLFLTAALLIYQYISHYGLLLLWISIAVFLVGTAYTNSNSKFLKREDGSISFFKKIFYFPYLITYKILWLFCRKNRKNPITEILPQIFIGAKLNAKQAASFINEQTYIIDLCAEAEEIGYIRHQSNYFSKPLLDIGSIKQEELETLLNLLTRLHTEIKPGEKIFIHCLMGYSRSVFITVFFLKRILNIELEEAIPIVTKKHLQSIFPKYLLNSN
ncbi:dual specificity protein phosphatase family protein [Flavobacterium hungaricum]|uniref:Tyrosine specific protein phosphatases domain-containing protein n=1 Tax=Flavobacterium hungaricum TaxID=2082725 RepID=A0ABR9TRA9_9FLAO|nr:dual specificity protein phosphatase family protein [Flavobacterium hungaricum]MBE8727903.1 hypothetical protein [Flavobacterium hungaricum]